METVLLVAAIVAVSLVCPAMMWLARRGIGPGCGVERRHQATDTETLDGLHARQGKLLEQIERLERERVQ
jgi:hypothetical protein